MKYKNSIFALLLVFVVGISCKKESAKIVESNKCNGFSEFCDKKLDDISILMTHNSYNNSEKKFLVPNQDNSIYKQLSDGVRGLMLDVYSSGQGPIMYHGVQQGGKQTLVAAMTEINKFLSENPREVIVIIFENYCSHDEILSVFDTLKMRDLIYVHNGTWPTLQQMIDNNQRLVLMVENEKGGTPKEILYAWNNVLDSKYEFQTISSMDCSENRGKNGLRTFYLLNHWISNSLGLPDKSKAKEANSFEVLGQRVKKCTGEIGHKVNFVGIDFYNIGNGLAVVDSINGVTR
ncbi:MAG: phosphatidylinositol-specific phospholipase C domain-containing protein [Chitinophagales bacterium]|nr:phosphatidylinositol-specific phospholipase C domain-containing protein [Chitinophagales bacterium]